MSKKITLGKVAITPKGRWIPNVQYEKLDVVLFEGSAWIARKANIGQVPSEESEYWRIAVEGVDTSSDAEEKVVAFLPDMFYLTPGVTLEIYNRQVCPDADKYHFKWTCSIGRAYKRKFSVTASLLQTGLFPLKLEIVNDIGDTVWVREVNMYVGVLNAYNTLNICPIGSMYSDGKAWLEEVSSNLSENQIGFTGNVAAGNGIFHEGRTGWSSTTYLTKAEEYNTDTDESMVNPFWNGERFSWQKYVDDYNRYCDAVQLFFGEDELLTSDADTLVNNLMQMIDSIRTEGGAFPIFVVLPPCIGNQDGIAKLVTSEYRNFDGKCKYEIDKMYIQTAKKIYDTISNSIYENVFFIPLTQCFDSENNFPTTTMKVNPRSSASEKIQSNPRKPTEEGYKQMADVMYGVYSVILAQ